MHMGIINSGRQADGNYDYSALYEDIYPQLLSADIKIINQETILEMSVSSERVCPAVSVYGSPQPVRIINIKASNIA